MIAVIGGGAAGFFAAISAAEANPNVRVRILERSGRFLSKVRISGGGRCNVTHDLRDPKELIKFYPRGSKELRGPFHSWGPTETIRWFQRRGVRLKTESDGRMFPVTDNSQTIVECLMSAARDHDIELSPRRGVAALTHGANGFELQIDDETIEARRVIIATGGGAQSGGLAMARSMGHTSATLAPSLFTFQINDKKLKELQGVAIPSAEAKLAGSKLKESGPILITHWGLSGPAILKLSARAAREFAERDYDCDILVNWIHAKSTEAALEDLLALKRSHSKKSVRTFAPFSLPKRFWERWLDCAGILGSPQWAQVGKDTLRRLAESLANDTLHVSGKSMNKEEFVTCGGVTLREVDFRTMESRIRPGLFFAGEVLDIDALTGGFNFQAAWTTGRIAGTHAAKF